MKLRNVKIDYHRNGICGAGFHVVRFDWEDTLRNGEVQSGEGFVATVFDAPTDEDGYAIPRHTEFTNPKVAVLDPANLDECWRGDQFADAIYEAIHAKEQEERKALA